LACPADAQCLSWFVVPDHVGHVLGCVRDRANYPRVIRGLLPPGGREGSS
jgi:hypothetical protein